MDHAVSILLVEDDEDTLLSLSRALRSTGVPGSIFGASNKQKAIELFEELSPHVVVLDLSLNENEGVKSGFELLSLFAASKNSTRLIVLTGHNSAEHGVRALNLGAANFLEKPADTSHLAALIKDGIFQADLQRKYLSSSKIQKLGIPEFIGTSDVSEKIREEIRYAAHAPLPVLISGETGTGKGLVARLIHALSPRSKSTFVRLQPNFASADLIYSELFGHTKGSFTGATDDRVGLLETAKNGSLFIDEIDEMPADVQVTLLGALQDKLFRKLGSSNEIKSDFRLISATNRNIDEIIKSGKLREDLFHRISTIHIHLTPLKNRNEDIAPLANAILENRISSGELPPMSISRDALLTLQKHNWPGNVRELQAAVERAAYRTSFGRRGVIEASDLFGEKSDSSNSTNSIGFHEQVELYKRNLVEAALSKSDGNQAKAAEILGIDRSSIRRILERVA